MCLKPVHIHCLVSIWKVSLWNDELTFTNSLSCSLNSFSPSILYIFLEWVSLHCVKWSLSFPAPQICPAGLPGATLHLPGRRLQTAGVGPAGVSLQPPGHPPKRPRPQRRPHPPALPTPVRAHHELHPAQEWGPPKPTGTGDSQSNRTVIPECSCSCSRSFRMLGYNLIKECWARILLLISGIRSLSNLPNFYYHWQCNDNYYIWKGVFENFM